MGVRDEDLADFVLVLGLDALGAEAAPALLAVQAQRGALDVAGDGQGDGLVFLGDEVQDVDVAGGVQDLGAALIAELLAHADQLVLDHLHQQAVVGQQALQVLDGLEELGVLRLDLVALQAGQAPKLHVQDVAGLDLAQAELGHQACAGLFRGLAGADQRDDGVDVVQRDAVALEDVGALAGLAQQVAGASGDHVAAVRDVVQQHLLQGQHPGLAVDDGQQDGAEGDLQVGVLVQLVEDDVLVGVALALDDHAASAAVGLVADGGDALDALLAHQARDLVQYAVGADLVGQLVDDDGLALADLLQVGAGAHDHPAAAGGVGVLDARAAVDQASGREVRTGHDAHQVGGVQVGVVDERDGGVDDLPQVVRRNLRRHADGDALAAVDQQVGEGGRQDRRLQVLTVEVGVVVDGLLVDVPQQLFRQLAHPALGVPVGGGAVSVGASEVALSVDQRVP